ncbi:putative gustatory receptor 59b [Drosophila serrata]|uniref:putative gustatory receptor 59b n=1 Tax=Drosophila serrata TaxID=7274 RepID=UPI000A1D07A6|nr:putative gustatory receptor 59b [Drosophila serrata]
MERLLGLFHGYALLIGLTSYKVVNGIYRQTWLTRAYALVLNVLIISILPFVFWTISWLTASAPWLPDIMFITPFILYTVNYANIVYILTSRFYRDSMLIDLLYLSKDLNRKMEQAGMRRNAKLQRLLSFKTFTFSFLCVAPLTFLGSVTLDSFIVNAAYSILNATTYFYFASFWQIARGFVYVNEEIAKIIVGGLELNNEELRDLWYLHSTLSRMAHRINRNYGLQMIVSRLDFIIYTIIFGYVGMIFLHEGITLIKFYASLLYLVRTVDFFLNDFICELTSRYQSHPKHEISEGVMSQELSDYLIYESSLRLDLKVCGLYITNKTQWLQTMAVVMSNSMLLLQFYLILRDDDTENI